MLRPTLLPHLAQLRLSSGTSACAMIAFAASTGGAGGTVVRPAPSRAARIRCDPVRVRRVEPVPEPARLEPMAADSTRLDEVATEPAAWETGSASRAAAPGASAGVPQTSQ